MRSKISRFLVLSLLFYFFQAATVCVAQDDPAAEDKPVASAQETEPSEEENEVPQEPEAPAEAATETGERIIYVPFKDLDGTFQDNESNVVVPYGVYQEFLEAWKKRNEKSPAPAAVVKSADYRVTVDGDLARISANLKIQVLGKPWVWIRIKFGEASISKITGDDVLLHGVGNGEYEFHFETPGEKNVQLELALPINQSPDGRQFVFDVPPAGLTTLDLTVPRKDQSINVTPKIVELPLPDANPEDDVTRLRANVGATRQIKVDWHPRTSLKPEMNLLASVNNQTLVRLEDGLIHTDAWLTYEILRGSMEQCRVVVPAAQRILDVSANSRIKSWKAEEQDGQQVVTIDFLTAVDKPVTIELHTEQALPENGLLAAGGRSEEGPAQGIHALDVVRESGQLVIRHTSDYTVTIAEQQGVVRIEEGEVDSKLKGKNSLAYKFYTPRLTLNLEAKPVEPRLMVTHQATMTFQEEELQSANILQYTVERAGVFELKLTVPDGLVVDDVQSNKMKEYNFNEQSRELTVTLQEKTLGKFNLMIRSHMTLNGDQTDLTLPLVEPLNVERETGTISVFARDAIEVVTAQEGLTGAQPLPSSQVRNGNTTLNSVWSFTRRPVTIPVSTKRKPTRLSAQVGTTIDVQPELTQVQTQMDFLIEYSGVDTFRFEVPEAVSTDLRIEISPGDQESAPIKQKTASEPVDGWVTWTVITQREVLGRQRFLITYDAKATEADEENESAQTTELDLLLLRPLGMVNDAGEPTAELANSQGEIVVKKERSLSISAEASGGDIEPIDLRELRYLPQSGTLAYRYYKSDAEDRGQVTIKQARYDVQQVVATVVSRGLVEIVAGEDSEANYRARFHVKTTERQRLLVHLPVNLEVLGTFLNDREVKLEKAEIPDADKLGENWSPFWVNVARTESSDQAFQLTFQFLWRVNPPLGESTFGRGRMALPLPVLGRAGESVSQEIKVVVWVPEKYVLVGDPEDFHLKTRRTRQPSIWGSSADRQTDSLDSWVTQGIASPNTAAQFPTEGRVPYIYSNLGGATNINVMWWNQVLMTTIVSVAIGLIALVLLRTSWENKLGMLLIAGFAATLYGLSDSHALHQGILAARFGLILLIGLWVIHGVFGVFHTLKSAVIVSQGGASSTVSTPLDTTSSSAPVAEETPTPNSEETVSPTEDSNETNDPDESQS